MASNEIEILTLYLCLCVAIAFDQINNGGEEVGDESLPKRKHFCACTIQFLFAI